MQYMRGDKPKSALHLKTKQLRECYEVAAQGVDLATHAGQQ